MLRPARVGLLTPCDVKLLMSQFGAKQQVRIDHSRGDLTSDPGFSTDRCDCAIGHLVNHHGNLWNFSGCIWSPWES